MIVSKPLSKGIGSNDVLIENIQLKDLQNEIEQLKISETEKLTTITELKTEVEETEKEREFYFEKLRNIEILLQEVEDKGEGNDVTASILKILYATADGFDATNMEVENSEETY